MWNAQRAINTIAVLKGRIHRPAILIVARLAEVVRPEAAIKGHAATELALPIDLRCTVILTLGCASANLLEQTVLAEKVLLSGLLLFSVCHFLFAVPVVSPH